MRILALADAPHPALYGHFDRSRWPGIQLVVGCGDLPAEYLDFVATSLGVPVVYVRGNHDGGPGHGREFPGDDLEGRILSLGGVRLLGFEGCAWYGGKGIEYTQRQMAWHAYRLYPSLWFGGAADIVVSHAAPVLDPELAPAVELTEPFLRVGPLGDYRYFTSEPGPSDPPHRGFVVFNDLIHRFRPRLWLHGHSHLNYSRAARVHRLGDTLVANAYEYLVVDLPPRPRPAR